MTPSNHSDVALRLSVLEDRLATCRLEPDSEVPGWATEARFFSVTRTPDEVSVVCLEQKVPDGVKLKSGWRALRIEGPLDFSLVGVLASLLVPLAGAGISVFTVSTYDTDYVLVKEGHLDSTVAVLRDNGHEIAKT